MQDASEKSCLRRSGASRTGHFEMNVTGAVRAASIRDSKCDSQRGHQYGGSQMGTENAICSA